MIILPRCHQYYVILKLLPNVIVFEGVQEWGNNSIDFGVECRECFVSFGMMKSVGVKKVCYVRQFFFKYIILDNECIFPRRVINFMIDGSDTRVKSGIGNCLLLFFLFCESHPDW